MSSESDKMLVSVILEYSLNLTKCWCPLFGVLSESGIMLVSIIWSTLVSIFAGVHYLESSLNAGVH